MHISMKNLYFLTDFNLPLRIREHPRIQKKSSLSLNTEPYSIRKTPSLLFAYASAKIRRRSKN